MHLCCGLEGPYEIPMGFSFHGQNQCIDMGARRFQGPPLKLNTNQRHVPEELSIATQELREWANLTVDEPMLTALQRHLHSLWSGKCQRKLRSTWCRTITLFANSVRMKWLGSRGSSQQSRMPKRHTSNLQLIIRANHEASCTLSTSWKS